MKLFFDTEFTGLHKDTTLISIGIIAEFGEYFYCEMVDYDLNQVDDWIKENVIANLKYKQPEFDEDYYYVRTNHFNQKNDDRDGFSIEMQGFVNTLKDELTEWLSQFDEVEMWSDCLAYDWVLFNNIFGTAFDIPENVYYIPFDICTLFKMKGVDPDISREEYSKMADCGDKHNSLWDAIVIRACYDRLVMTYV